MKKIIIAAATAVLFAGAIGAANAYEYSKSVKPVAQTEACSCDDCSCDNCACTDNCGSGSCDAGCCDKECSAGCCK